MPYEQYRDYDEQNNEKGEADDYSWDHDRHRPRVELPLYPVWCISSRKHIENLI